MGGLNMPGIKIIVGEDGTADGADHDAPVLNTQIRHSLAYELMQYSVSAARTIMRGRLRGPSLTREFGIQTRMPSDQFLFCCHFYATSLIFSMT
jgi:hypothetical protein